MKKAFIIIGLVLGASNSVFAAVETSAQACRATCRVYVNTTLVNLSLLPPNSSAPCVMEGQIDDISVSVARNPQNPQDPDMISIESFNTKKHADNFQDAGITTSGDFRKSDRGFDATFTDESGNYINVACKEL